MKPWGSRLRRIGLIWAALAWAGASLSQAAENSPTDQLNLEAHGYVSFGHLKTWGNNWLGETRNGTNEFWETALNVTARPLDRLRLGAQLFARDYANYDNGKPQLDLLYADYRAMDPLGIQIGRVKIPIGLYNESRDFGSDQAQIVVALPVIGPRARDFFVSTDGAKIYGSYGQLEYTLFGGRKEMDPELGTTTYFRQAFSPILVDRLKFSANVGGMLHWNTPIEGLAARTTFLNLHDFALEGRVPKGGGSADVFAENYVIAVASVLYETGDMTWVGEYSRHVCTAELSFSQPGLASRQVPLNQEGAYVGATWHAKPWLEFYAGGEGRADDPGSREESNLLTAVLAVHVLPLPNWSIKAEFRDNYGDKGIFSVDNPAGIETRWQVLAFKTTVDF